MASIACVPSSTLAHPGRERERDNGPQAGGHTLGRRWPGQAAAGASLVLPYGSSALEQCLPSVDAVDRRPQAETWVGRYGEVGPPVSNPVQCRDVSSDPGCDGGPEGSATRDAAPITAGRTAYTPLRGA
jgi:hypothetical protein